MHTDRGCCRRSRRRTSWYEKRIVWCGFGAVAHLRRNVVIKASLLVHRTNCTEWSRDQTTVMTCVWVFFTLYFFLCLFPFYDINSAATAAKWVYIVCMCAFAHFSRLLNVSMDVTTCVKELCVYASNWYDTTINLTVSLFFISSAWVLHACLRLEAKRIACILHTQNTQYPSHIFRWAVY